MATAGRATLFSGMIVAIGLALLVFMPLPFMRSMGVGGLLVPLVSIAASATLLPALLAARARREPLAGHPRGGSSSAARTPDDDRAVAPAGDVDHAPPGALLLGAAA